MILMLNIGDLFCECHLFVLKLCNLSCGRIIGNFYIDEKA